MTPEELHLREGREQVERDAMFAHLTGKMSRCQHCGGLLVWQNKEMRVAMCPNCVMERCVRAELKLGIYPASLGDSATRSAAQPGLPQEVPELLREALAGLRDKWERNIKHLLEREEYLEAGVVESHIDDLEHILAAHPAVPTGRQAGVELPETERQADEEREDLRLQRHCSMRSAPQPVQQDGEQEVFTSQGGEFPGWCKHCDKHRSLHRHGGSSHVGEPEYCSNALPPTPGSERE